MQPKSQKYVSSPPVSYMKAIEIIIHNSRQLQTDVWAKTSTHQHLASRFKMLNQWLNFPSVLLSAIFTTGTLVTINKTDFSLVLGVLGGLVTILVTLSTHFDFAGSSNSHRQTSHALRRFDRRLNHFMHRLILRGGAGKIIDEEGNGISFNELTNPKQDDTLETSNLKLRKIFNIKLEELLEIDFTNEENKNLKQEIINFAKVNNFLDRHFHQYLVSCSAMTTKTPIFTFELLSLMISRLIASPSVFITGIHDLHD